MSDDIDDKSDPRDEDSLTPEEKLFRAIIADDAATQEEEVAKPVATQKEPSFFAKLGAKIKDAISKINLKPKRAIVKPPENRGLRTRALAEIADVKTLNRGMLIVVFMLLVYLILDIFFGSQKAIYEGQGYPTGTPADRNSMSSTSFEAPRSKPLSHYLDVVQSRDAFSPFVPIQEQVEVDPEQPTVLESAPAEIPEIRLVGISWDSDGYVAMVEVAEENFAKFVSAGDTVINDVQVKEVQEYKVVLTRNGQEWNLN